MTEAAKNILKSPRRQWAWMAIALAMGAGGFNQMSTTKEATTKNSPALVEAKGERALLELRISELEKDCEDAFEELRRLRDQLAALQTAFLTRSK